MNEKAQAMGCTGTHFANATGLHNDDHYTTARDMSIIARAAFSNETLRQIAGTPAYTLPATNLSEARTIYSTAQRISDNVNSNYLYQYAVCGKTGYTSQAGRCLVSCAMKDDTALISVVMKTGSIPLDDGSTRVMSFYETKRLFEYGFNSWSTQTLLTQGSPVTEVNVKLGSNADSVVLCAGSDITYLLKNGYDQTQISKVVTVYNEDNITAPVNKGDELGKIELVASDGTALGSAPLVAQTQLERSIPEAVVDSVRDTVNKPLVKSILIMVAIVVIAALIVANARRRIEKRRQQEEKKRLKSQEIRRRQQEEDRKYSGKK
jgi:D-alanyl-D-alanine carboxypeptidase (penicillin-binding protein 5/6)